MRAFLRGLQAEFRFILLEAVEASSDALNRLPLNRKLIFSGVVVGAAAGISAYVLESLIHLFSRVGIDRLESLPWTLRVIATTGLPAFGGLAAGWILHFHPEAKGLGLYEVVKAIRDKRGKIEPNVVWGKSLASAATIGFGGSAGQEGPVIHIGAAAGSWVGQKLRLSHEDWRAFAAGGAVGGLAAAFSIPLAGVFFTMEVILKDFASEAFSAVVISSVTGTFVARALLGQGAFFPALSYQTGGPLDFLRFGLLGVLCAPMGQLYRYSLKGFETLFTRLRDVPEWTKPAVGGFLVGALALISPRILGTGRETIDAALGGGLTGASSAGLAFLKIAATSLTLGAGAPGGSLMPALFVGAMTGGAFAHALALIPGFPQPAGALAAVGMACLFTSAFEAPLTAIVMALELTQDYGLLLPAMFACAITYVFSRRTETKTAAPAPPKPAPAHSL